MANNNDIIITVTDRETQEREKANAYVLGLPWLSSNTFTQVEKLSQNAWIVFFAAAGMVLTMAMLARRA